MRFRLSVDGRETEIEADIDHHSFYTILNFSPGKEHLGESIEIPQNLRKKAIKGKAITGNISLDDKVTTGQMVFVNNYQKNVIGWKQLHDLGIRNGRDYVFDIPPVLLTGQPNHHQGYLVKRLLADANRVIRSWLRMGIIEPFESDCNNPIRLAKKQNGKVKIIFNFCKLTQCEAQRVKECNDRNQAIASISLGHFYSVIKLYYAEWQIPLDSKTKYKTAFTFLGKQYVWNRLQGNMSFMWSILSRALEAILDKLPQNVRKRIVHFRDAILLSADNERECDQLTDQLLHHLEEHSFRPRDSGLVRCQPQVEYLGRKVTTEGIGIGRTFIRDMEALPQPTNARKLKSILSFLGDVRRFTPGFGVLAKHLYALENKSDNWVWEKKHREALANLIKQIPRDRIVVPGLKDGEQCTIQVFVKKDDWMAEILNSDKKPYRSASGTLSPTKAEQMLAVREMKAMREVSKAHETVLESREVVWEVESPEVKRYKEDPTSLNINKSLDLSFLWKPNYVIRVVPPVERSPPIPWPEEF